MARVRIVTDSAQDFPPEYMENLGITVVPLTVHFGDESQKDWYEIRGSKFYDRLIKGDVLPRTSQPSPAAFEKVFGELTQDGSEVVCVTLSSGVSGTYQSAVIAKDSLRDRTITVFDSKHASCGEGILAILAQEMADSGMSSCEIAGELEKMAGRVVTLFSVDTLLYLEKNGRIGRAQRFMGTLLNMKPILTLDKEGYVSAVERVRGKGKVIPTLIEMAKEKAGSDKAKVIAISHANCPDDAMELKRAVLAGFSAPRILESEIGAVIGSHVGPGTMALFILPERER